MTPGYSPPEQYGTARTDHRSDLFSLGATLYAALTGVIPEDALARAMDQIDLTSIRKRNPNISRRMAAVIEKSLAVRPDDRYQDAEEFKQALFSVRGITTRRKAGEYLVSPPPEPPGNGDAHANALASFAAEDLVPRPVNRSPSPVPRNISPEMQLILPNRKQRLVSAWPVIAVILLLLVLSGLASFQFYPAWPGKVLGFLLPAQSNPPVVAVGNPTGTPTSTKPYATATLAASLTHQPSPAASLTPTDSPTSTETPANPTRTPTIAPTPVGGGSGQIAFASDRSGTTQIWLMNVDGSGEPVQLTNIPEGACQPGWSPDGMRLVFISPCSKNEDTYHGTGLFLINVDGTGQTPLPTVPGGDFDPDWSPDGNFIAFTSRRNGGRPRIYLLDLRDDSVKRLSEQYSYASQPAWSPDGKKIAYMTTQKGPVQIWTMNADGSNQAIFTRSADAINTHPVWSVDGEMILFNQVESNGGPPYIVAVSYKDGVYSEYRFAPWPVKEARYSPDGLWLVFESWPQGSNHDIYIMSASGAARTQLTAWERHDFDPAWRPALP